jgi:hypothetical protein
MTEQLLIVNTPWQPSAQVKEEKNLKMTEDPQKLVW